MRGVSAVSALFTALLCVGCSDGGSPAGPSSFRGDSLPTNSTAGQAASLGASVSPTPTAARVPFKGTLEGSQTTTPLGPTQAFSVVSATGTATLLGRFTLEIPHTVDFAAQTGDGTYTFTAANGDTLTADFTGEAQVGRLFRLWSTRRSRVAQVDSPERRELHRPPAVRSGQRHDHRFVRGDYFGAWCRKVVRQKRRRAPARRLGGAGGLASIHWRIRRSRGHRMRRSGARPFEFRVASSTGCQSSRKSPRCSG